MLNNPFHVDLRALAAVRIGVGLLILVDLMIRASDLGWFMSEWGVLDTAASRLYADQWRFSLYWLSSSFVWTCALFVCAALAATLLVFGVRTRLATVVSFLLLASLHNRNPLLLQGGDNLLLLLTFWGMMLPWGARWSIDAVMSEQRKRPDRLGGFAAAAILLQVVSVYFFS
ncbi:MAG: HTTM domain-containing protein, partial [Gammaproteobacteria bacterium]